MASGTSNKKKQSIKEAPSIFKHKSFRRSYREDYVRELEVPGMMYHILYTFKMIFKNWKLFLPFLLIMTIAAIAFVGLMSENTYRDIRNILDQTAEQNNANIGTFAKSGLLLVSTVFTGGLSVESNNAGAGVFVALIFLIIWLVTIFLLRHIMAGHKVKLRDGLYNAMTPLISTFVVLLVAVIQCLPIMIFLIAYSAAIETHFLDTPFYALLFWVFSALMFLLSFYLVSGTIMALTAVTAPGLYPIQALKTANDLMAGRRIKFILRIIALIIVLIIMWAVVMMPLIMFDLFMKQFSWTVQIPFVPVCLVIMTCFSGIYVATYFYLYYRYMLDFDTKDSFVKKTKRK